MSRSAVASPNTDFLDCADVVAYLHSKGLKHFNERKVLRATYEGRKLLKRTKVQGRTYWRRHDIDAWIDQESQAG